MVKLATVDARRTKDVDWRRIEKSVIPQLQLSRLVAEREFQVEPPISLTTKPAARTFLMVSHGYSHNGQCLVLALAHANLEGKCRKWDDEDSGFDLQQHNGNTLFGSGTFFLVDYTQ